jgi:hypothetical protein
MKKHHNILEEVKWAESRRNSEAPKYTWWSGGESSAKLGGFTLTNQGKYHGSEVDGSVKVTAHTSHGLSYWKHFDIPLDKVDEFCHALMKVRDFSLGLKKSEEHLKEHNE